jgi:hypothetical protein
MGTNQGVATISKGNKMNERIRQLAEQAGYLPDSFGVGHWDMPECKKFAELIVRDVLDEVLQAMDDGMDVYDTVADKFGVEE